MQSIDLTKIPTEAGVYRFFHNEEVIYVGKAKNLRNRLSSYFHLPKNFVTKTHLMVEKATSLDWTILSSESESLILEYMWIKQFNPQYNIIFRDDKSYPYIAVDYRYKFPKIYKTRKKIKDRNIYYYGPYPKATAVNIILELLQQTLKFRTCSQSVFNEAKRSYRPCLLGQIDKCLAPCLIKDQGLKCQVSLAKPKDSKADCDTQRSVESGQSYLLAIKQAQHFLSGKQSGVLQSLNKKMLDYSNKEEFEKASAIRDQIMAVNNIWQKQNIEIKNADNLDVHALYVGDLTSCVFSVNIRASKIIGVNRSFSNEKIELKQTWENFLATYYFTKQRQLPHSIAIISDGNSMDSLEQDWFNALQSLFTNMNEQNLGANNKVSQYKTLIFTPRRGSKLQIAKQALANAKQAYTEHSNERLADINNRSKALNELQYHLNLPKVAFRIECYDISHTSGTNQRGAMVVFNDGLKTPSDYRLFSIQNASDDTAAIFETLTRRFKKDWAKPDLILIDGGLPQVNAAYRAVGSTIPVIGIAKRLEEIWLPSANFPLILPRESLSLFLLQQLRDEAHRFSITAHRKARQKKQSESSLEKIVGLGEVGRLKLLKTFGSLIRIKSAELTEIQEVLGNKTGKKIYDQLHN